MLAATITCLVGPRCVPNTSDVTGIAALCHYPQRESPPSMRLQLGGQWAPCSFESRSKRKLLPSDIFKEMENRPGVSWACRSASECMLNVSKGLDLIPGNQKNQKNN